MKKLTAAIVTLLVLLALAACGAPGTAQPVASVPTAATQPATRPTAAPEPTASAQPTAAPTTAPTAAPEPTADAQPTAAPTAGAQPTAATKPADADSGVIAIFHKSGGIMGLDETLTVHADGTLEFKGRGNKLSTAQVSTDRLAKLRQLLASPEFAKLQPRYQAMGADLFIYDISVPGGTPARVQTMDGAETPPVLEQVIKELVELRTGL